MKRKVVYTRGCQGIYTSTGDVTGDELSGSLHIVHNGAPLAYVGSGGGPKLGEIGGRPP